MGSFLGERIPEYNPFWDDPDYRKEIEQPPWYQWFHLGYDTGYACGTQHRDSLQHLEQENEALRALIAANVRIIKEELRKELGLDKLPNP